MKAIIVKCVKYIRVIDKISGQITFGPEGNVKKWMQGMRKEGQTNFVRLDLTESDLALLITKLDVAVRKLSKK